MLQTEVTITNHSCGVVHLIGEQFEARIAGYDEFTGTMPASVFDANVAQFAVSHPYVEIVEGETADDGVPEPVIAPASSISLSLVDGLSATNLQSAVEEMSANIYLSQNN